MFSSNLYKTHFDQIHILLQCTAVHCSDGEWGSINEDISMKSFSPPAPAMATPPPQQLLLQPCSRDNTCNPNLYSSALPKATTKTFNNLYGRNVFQHDSCAFVGLRCDNPTVAATTQAADVVRHCTAATSTLSSPSLAPSSSSSSSSSS